MMTTRHSILTVTLTLLTGLLAVTLRGQAPADHSDLVDTNGNIRRPSDYRDRYQLLGVYTVLDPKGNEMHYTCASPGAAEFYRKNGRFADGTVLVKEVLATSHARLTTGDAHWADSTKVWFVMMKDDKGRFPNNPLWGNGWGWALFKSDAPGTQVPRTSRKTVSAVISPRNTPTGFTCVAIQCSARSEQDVQGTAFEHSRRFDDA